jgi:hypothetical protein
MEWERWRNPGDCFDRHERKNVAVAWQAAVVTVRLVPVQEESEQVVELGLLPPARCGTG